MSITVQNDIPIPDEDETHSLTKYPWHKMEVGCSFFSVPRENEDQRACRIRLVSVTYNRRKFGHKYRLKAITENGIDGVRMWRIE